jgi:hypothetical protein
MDKLDNSISILDLPTDDELFLEVGDEPSDHPPSRKAVRKKSSRVTDCSAVDQIEGVQQTVVSARGRWIVVLVLCLCACGMAITTFLYITRSEQDEFEAAVRTNRDGMRICLSLYHFSTRSLTLLLVCN